MNKSYEFRCPKCNRLLMKYKYGDKQLIVEVKCNNCKTISGMLLEKNPEKKEE